jgi:hypothetical protein
MNELINIFSKYKKEFDISDDTNIINLKVTDSTFNNQTIFNFYAVTQNNKYDMYGEINIGSVIVIKDNKNIKYSYNGTLIQFPVLCKADKRNYIIIKEIDNFIKNFFIK